MDIQPTTNTAATPSSNATNGRTGLTSDYEMFLKMLTTQMNNQDPLNPVDSSDYAVQLATFSSVEQQVLTNDLLTELTNKLSGGGLADYGSWIGREVKAAMPIPYSGSPITVPVSAKSGADSAALAIRNARGDTIRTMSISDDAKDVTWDGRSDDGAPVPAGTYDFQVISYVGDDVLSTESVETYGRITEARMTGTTPSLVLENGAQIDVSEVRALRE